MTGRLQGLLLSLFTLRSAVEAFLPSRNVQNKVRTTMGTSSTSSKNSGAHIDSSTQAVYQDVKGVIFDIDGTLADSWKLGFDATLVVLENNSIPPITQEIYHEFTRYATPERLARHAGLTPSDGIKFEEVGQTLGDEFDALYVGLVNTQTAGFFNGIGQLLQSMMETEGVKFGALTNACVDYAHAVLKANLDEEGYEAFHSIRGADNVPTPKPSPDGLLEVCKDIGLSPDQCVYIGDSPSDAGAAKAAGMPSIGVLWGSHGRESLEEAPFVHLCENVDELAALLGHGCAQPQSEEQKVYN